MNKQPSDFEPAYPGGRLTPVDTPILRIVLNVLRRRWITFAVVAGSIFIAAAIVTLMLTPKYVSTTLIKIDPSAQARANAGDTPVSSVPDQNVVDTEVNVMTSREIATSVVKSLRLENDREFTEDLPPPPNPSSAQTGAVNEWYGRLADNLLKAVSVERQRQTYVVSLTVQSVDPVKAAAIANAFAQAYMKFSVTARTGTAAQMSDFLTQRLNALGSDLSAQDAQVAQLKAQAGIIEGGTAGTMVDQQLAPLAVQLATAQSEAAAAQSQIAAARQQIAAGGIDNVSGVLSSSVVADLRRQRAEVQREASDVQSRYGPKHPSTIKVEQQLSSIDKQIQEEGNRVVNGMASNAAAASARAASLRSQVLSLQGAQSSTTRAAVQADALEKQADAKRETYNRLAAALQQSMTQARNTMTQAEVVQLAAPAAEPSSPNRPLLLIAGLALGLLAGAALVALQELLTRGLRTPAEFERHFNKSLLTSLTRLTSKQLSIRGETVAPADHVVERPITAFAEALRALRSSLTTESGITPKVVALVSALPAEGKTSTTYALARVLAMAGERVLLIDGDLRRAGLSKSAGQDFEVGLVELLHDQAGLEQAVYQDRVPNLELLPVSKSLMSAEDLFGGERMQRLLATVGPRYDRIIIDTPPLLGVADARTLALLADAVVILVKWDSTPIDAVEHAITQLEQDGAPLIGAVYTMVDPGSEAVGAMYYSRKYAAYYQEA